MPNKGKILFGILAWMAFAYAFGAGVFLTADSLSEEKREGTLGLLFLTDLRGYDVVLGKLAATSLHAVYGVVAAFPILAISLLLGGLLASEFWTGMLAILNMLFVSLAAGMLASTFTREALPAMNVAVAILGLLAGLPYLVDLGLAFANGQKFAIHTGVAATLHPFLIAIGGVRGSYWFSLLLSHVAGWLCLTLAAWRVRHTWQEQPVKSTTGKTRSVARLADEAAWRTDEPILWLASRSKRFRLWILLPVFAAVGLISFLLDAGPVSMTIAMGLANILGLLLFLWMTAHATRFFVDGVRTGAFELILCTPMPASEIVRGQWIAYMRAFGLPLLFLIFAEQILASMQWLGSGAAMYAYAIASQVNSAITSITTAGAIGWFGMWMGLRSRKPHIAVIKTFVFVFILPAVAIGIFQTIFMIAVGFGGGFTGRQVLGPAITCFLWVMKDAAFILWARRNLYGNFREAVAGINLPRRALGPVPAIPSGPG